MNNYCKLLVIASLALSSPVFAGTGGVPGSCIDDGLRLNATHSPLSTSSFDPYSYLLPADLNSAGVELSTSYSIELKPLYSDDMSRYQFNTVDNRGPGAGYSSPYLWEAGRAPGYANPSFGPISTPTDRRAFSPIPMGR